MADGLRRCRAGQCETSVTAGAILAGTRTPLVSWFAAVCICSVLALFGGAGHQP